MLHTVNKSPYASNALESCLRFASPGDVILLIEDGVYAAAGGTSRSGLVEGALRDDFRVMALAGDVKARALTDLIQGVELTDPDGWVDLLEQHTCQAWL